MASMFHRRDPALLRRNEVYLELLYLGLLRIRNSAAGGDYRHSGIEADHLHNVPSYIAGGDQADHLFYLTVEVPYYLERVDMDMAESSRTVAEYIPRWKELETLVPVEGSRWAEKWLAMKAAGWSYERAASGGQK